MSKRNSFKSTVLVTETIPGRLTPVSVREFETLKKGDEVFVRSWGNEVAKKGVFVAHEHWRGENSHAEIDLHDAYRHSVARQWVCVNSAAKTQGMER